MRGLYFLLIVAVIGVGVWYNWQRKDTTLYDFFVGDDVVMSIDGVKFAVEVASTSEARTLGLSGRDDLGGVLGLLMVFNEPGYHGIWMKDMRFSIDVIWISEDLRVIDITRRLLPESYPRIYEPAKPAKYVLETKPDLVDAYGISVGDEVTLPAGVE